MKRNLAEARAAIQYDPTQANSHQLRQWAKDSMAQAYATRREGPEPDDMSLMSRARYWWHANNGTLEQWEKEQLI